MIVKRSASSKIKFRSRHKMIYLNKLDTGFWGLTAQKPDCRFVTLDSAPSTPSYSHRLPISLTANFSYLNSLL